MNTRHTGVITALLLTAALFLYMPGLLRSFVPADLNRMNENLRPPRMRTLTVWTLPGRTGDQKLISQACPAFEKAHPGVRIFLRVADAEELYAQDAVLPDVALFDTGGVNLPEGVFLPLAEETESSALYAGVSYAVPLWLSPNVLSLPESWVDADADDAPGTPSLLADQPPVPAQEGRDVIDASSVPWERLLQPGALECPDGVALQQLQCMLPYADRAALASAVRAPLQDPHARILSLRDHLRAVQDGQALTGCLLSPAVCDRVHYAALCRDGQDARDFLTFLQTDMAEEAIRAGFIPLGAQTDAAEGLARQAAEQFGGVRTLPNAFAHTRSELEALCRDSFDRALDPVETLLKLR